MLSTAQRPCGLCSQLSLVLRRLIFSSYYTMKPMKIIMSTPCQHVLGLYLGVAPVVNSQHSGWSSQQTIENTMANTMNEVQVPVILKLNSSVN